MTISAISNAQPAQAQVKNTQKHSYFNPANITGYATGLEVLSLLKIKVLNGINTLLMHQGLLP